MVLKIEIPFTILFIIINKTVEVPFKWNAQYSVGNTTGVGAISIGDGTNDGGDVDLVLQTILAEKKNEMI